MRASLVQVLASVRCKPTLRAGEPMVKLIVDFDPKLKNTTAADKGKQIWTPRSYILKFRFQESVSLCQTRRTFFMLIITKRTERETGHAGAKGTSPKRGDSTELKEAPQRAEAG